MASEKTYDEALRPQFHFSPRKNWTNDPNGLVFLDGEYHLFFQHNPEGINWGNMTWGHAVSPDLVRWTQLDHAIHPDELGTIFSGSAVVDVNNTAGFQTGDTKVIVAIYTSHGPEAKPDPKPATQSIAYSNDRGRTWEKYDGNPVLDHVIGGNRDPKVIWHEPTGKWVMALYLDADDYALFGSPNLKEWTKLSDLKLRGDSECPDFFELAVDGDANNKKWVFWGGSGTYLIGSFDGTTSTPETDVLVAELGANGYAAQSYSDIPADDGRRIQISWLNGGTYHGMPFNQQMSFPVEMTLRTLPEGIRLCRRPVCEIETVRAKEQKWEGVTLNPGDDLLSDIKGELFDIRAEIEPAGASFEISVGGRVVRYDVAREELICPDFAKWRAPLRLIDGRVKIQILVDRTSLEIYGNDGEASMTYFCVPDQSKPILSITAAGGPVNVVSLEVHGLKSAWFDR